MRRLKLMLTVIAILTIAATSYGDPEAALLRFDAEGFTVDAEGFSVQRVGLPGGVAVVLSLPRTEDFTPNVNVFIQDYADSISEYVSLSKSQFDSLSYTIVKEQTLLPKDAIMEYVGIYNGRPLHWYSRAVKNGSKVYLITATAALDQWNMVSEQLIRCVESFSSVSNVHVINTGSPLGWSLEQCKASYGAPTFGPGRAHNASYYVWEHPDGFYMVYMSSAGAVMVVTYGAYKTLDNNELYSLFKRNAPNAQWEAFSFSSQLAGHLYWVGRENGSATMIAESYIVVRDDGTNSYCVTVGTPQAMMWMSENP